MKHKIEVFVGAEEAQLIPYQVLKTSILKHTKAEIDIHSLHTFVRSANGRTPFSEQRFFIPAIAKKTSGYAIYLDSDMVLFDDILNLIDQAERSCSPIVGVKQQEDDPRGNQSSVIVFKLYKMQRKSIDEINSILLDYHIGKYSYEDIFKTLKPFDGIDYCIPWQWNSLDLLDADTKLLHYTNMETQPWLSSVSPLSRDWERRLADLPNTLIQEHKKFGFVRPNLNDRSKLGYLKEIFWYPPGNIPKNRPWLYSCMRSHFIGGFVCFALRIMKVVRSKRERTVFKILLKQLITGKHMSGGSGIFQDYD